MVADLFYSLRFPVLWLCKLLISLVRVLLTRVDRELVYILVTRENTPFYNHAEQFIMVGPVLDGLVGGISAFNGVVHAYVIHFFDRRSNADLHLDIRQTVPRMGLGQRYSLLCRGWFSLDWPSDLGCVSARYRRAIYSF